MTQLPVERPQDTAANEDFTGSFKRPEGLAHRAGWDPYEVWCTRVKALPLLAHQDEPQIPAPPI